MNEVLTPFRSPWQNAFGERHLTRVLREYQWYYNNVRPHLSLDGNSPVPRDVDGEEHGEHILSVSYLGGLHHQYYRAAA
jgi:hypothetical protein